MTLHPSPDPTEAMTADHPAVTGRRVKDTHNCPLQIHEELAALSLRVFLGSESGYSLPRLANC